MARIVLTNIKSLVNTRKENHLLRGKELNDLPLIENAFLEIEDGKIARYGSMKQWVNKTFDKSEIVDATGRFVLPAWCDSHTHLVFAAPRENEFVDKINGLTYAQIAS